MVSRALVLALIAVRVAGMASDPVCRDISIPVSINAVNKDIPSDMTAANITVQVLQTVPNMKNISISGDYVIGATYCEPATSVPVRHDTLQILIHGAAYTRTYWNSLGLDKTVYSWVDYATNQGYPTLAIDRLCNGLSSHPNGIFVCQFFAEAETVHQLVQIARDGSLPIGSSSRRFTKIIAVGHSVGSDLVSLLAQTHPADADASIFTGWTNTVINGIPTVAYGNVTPAYKVYPDRFGNLSSDPSYLTFASKTGQSYLSYYGNFEQSVQDDDYATQGTFTVGESLTQLFGQLPAPAYTGPVLILNGNEDATYCQPNILAATAKSIGNCSLGNSANSHANFPSSRQFSFSNTPDTGHCLNLHMTSPTSFQVAFDFLSRNGF